MIQKIKGQEQDWLDRYKTRIIIGIVSILTVTIVITMFFIAWTVRSELMVETKMRAEELGTVIHSSLNHLMQVRDPDRMQSTLIAIGRENPDLVRTFILDNQGRIAYSTQQDDVGKIIDRFTDPSCKGCHIGPVAVPHETTMILTVDGRRVLRYIHIIPNQQSCHQCHPASTKINGKLIIDRSLEPTAKLITSIITIIIAIGSASLLVLVPFLWRVLSRGVNTYISEIRLKSGELSLLYGIVERLSTTIELEELKRIVADILSEALDADEIDMILPNEYREQGVTVWAKTGNVMDRKKVVEGSALHEVILAWTDGKIMECQTAADGREIRMPINKGNSRVALLLIRSHTRTYDARQAPMVRAMANHIAVAFDNAFLYHIAITDELTALYSNRHFRQAIERRYAQYEKFGEKMTLLMIDIDNFKKVNDTYGHPVGDAILREVGKCIKSSIRDDDIAFRYGGEEFAVILPSTDPGAGRGVAERMRALIEHYPFRAEKHILSMTVSIGVASWPASADTIKDIIREADEALYEAKRSGKNQVAVRVKGTE
ncbi:MAG: GGDEF domain-containing protein [Nitrospiraceae bacterium]|nr:GGDEF domain-containing protein [Nitrospiraceae bacterium]